MNKIIKHIIYIYILLISFSLRSQVEGKFNLATSLFLIPNVGIEIPIDDKKSFQLDVLGSFWDEYSKLNNTPLHINQTFFEYRIYQNKPTSGFFIGPHIGYGMFTLEKPNYLIIFDYYSKGDNDQQPLYGDYKSGRVAYYGTSFGYKKRISKKLALELFLGVGLTQSKYKGYSMDKRVDLKKDEPYRSFNGSGEVLLYRGGLMINYKLIN